MYKLVISLIISEHGLTMDNCSFCHANNCIINFRGEYTCKCCGVVLNVELQDDYTPHFYDLEVHNTNVSSQVIKKINKLNRMCEKYNPENKIEKNIIHLCGVLEHKLMLDQTFTNITKDWFKLAIKHNGSNVKREILFVCCCYCVSVYLKRGWEFKVFCNLFGVELCQAWSYLPGVTDAFKTQRWYLTLMQCLDTDDAKIKRSVYQLSSIEPHQQSSVIKRACELYQMIKDCSKISVCRQINVRHTCVYIACCLTSVNIKKKLFCREMCLTAPTLSSIEKFIQEALLSMKS